MSRSSPLTPSPSDPPSSFRVADWIVYPDLNRLARGEESVRLEPRVMQVLVTLARRPGEVSSREALLEEVWGDVVIQEEALTHAISRLRRAFGDAARESSFIETIPKRGYRLIAPVAAAPGSPRPPGTDAPVHSSGRSAIPRPWALTGAILGAALGLWLVLGTDLVRRAARPELGILEGTPLTSYPGQESWPAVSPDGTRVAFAWVRGEEEGDLYSRPLKAENPTRLTSGPGLEHSPSWSPDGSELVFLRDLEDRTTIAAVPAGGGRERLLYESPVGAAIRGVDWCPTGERLVLAMRPALESPYALNLLDLRTGELTPLLADEGSLGGYSDPVCSPDGTRIAFVSWDRIGQSGIYCVDLPDGRPRRLTRGDGRIRGLDWTSDGGSVVFSSGTAFAGEFRLWRVEVESGERTWLPTRGRRSVHPSLARNTDVLVYAEETYRREVLRISLDPLGEPQPFARSSHSEYGAHHSPSGKSVAFVSTRTGDPEVYVCSADGEEIRRVTSLDGSNPEFLQWSWDEKFLAYDVMDGSRSAVYVTDVERGVTRAVTHSSEDEILHSWSWDGKAVYLRSLQEGEWRALRASLESGETEQVLPYYTYMLSEAPGGESLVFVRAGSNVVWNLDLASGEEEELFTVPRGTFQCYWKASPEGIFLYRRTDEGPQLAVHDLRTGETRGVFPIPPGHDGLLDVASDGSSLLYDQIAHVETDLVRVAPFPPTAAE